MAESENVHVSPRFATQICNKALLRGTNKYSTKYIAETNTSRSLVDLLTCTNDPVSLNVQNGLWLFTSSQAGCRAAGSVGVFEGGRCAV